MNDEIRKLTLQIMELKKQLAAAQKRAEPQPISVDYEFAQPDGSAVRLSELFGEHDDLLVVHNMGKSCRYCMLWADGFVSYFPHIRRRCSFALSSPDKPEVLREFASSRGWNYPCVSHRGTTFAKDMGFNPKPNEFWPGVSAFHKNADGSIVRTGCANFGPGDDFCPVWPLFDLLPEGARNWEPQYAYSS